MSILSIFKGSKGKKFFVWTTLILFVAVGSFAIYKKVTPVSWGWLSQYDTNSGVAIHGYDPVAYFIKREAVLGSPAISYKWKGSTWHFANRADKLLFQAKPELFAPQFGGYCAFAVSMGITATSEPSIWHMKDGKVYFFLSEFAKEEWVEKIDDGIIRQTEEEWSKR